jgi:hypothetical protein
MKFICNRFHGAMWGCVSLLLMNCICNRFHGAMWGCVSQVSAGIMKTTGVTPSTTCIGKERIVQYFVLLRYYHYMADVVQTVSC